MTADSLNSDRRRALRRFQMLAVLYAAWLAWLVYIAWVNDLSP